MCDVLIVGAGFCGSVIARFLAEEMSQKVLVIDRRNHIAGNMYDYTDENGVLVQKYGPHTFHTTKKHLYDYVNRFGRWEPYKLTCMAQIDGRFTPSPFNFQTIDDYYTVEKADQLKKAIKDYYGDAEKTTIVEMLENPVPIIQEYAQFLFDKDYSLYTAKQWGISPSEIDVSVLKRVPVLFSYKDGYFDDDFQVMPKESFTAFFENILNHENITVQLNQDAGSVLEIKDNRVYIHGEASQIPVVYTGAIDELLKYQFGVLPYRSLRFEYEMIEADSYQDAPVVAYPQVDGFTRITEYTKLPVQKIAGKTVIAKEYPSQYNPSENTEPYYPILTQSSQAAYEQYKAVLDQVDNLYCCGRLADFKYYNMDQALERALDVCEALQKMYERKVKKNEENNDS